MAYFNNKRVITEPLPIPEDPGYVPPAPPVPPSPSAGGQASVVHPSHSGSYTMELYINSSDNNVMSKSLSSVATISNIAWKENTSIINPVVIVDSNTDLTGCNYAYISAFGRYYYINNIEVMPGNLCALYLHCDVLMSFASSIASCSGVVRRQESLYNMYINDSEFKVEQKSDKKTIMFSNCPFSKTNQYYIAVSGGA